MYWDGTWEEKAEEHKTVALGENGGNDGVSGSVGRIAYEEFLVLTMFMMLDDRG